jgi:flagellin-like hook-associated protein FlgL
MDVKDVQNANNLANKPSKNSAQALQKSLRSLSSPSLQAKRLEAVRLEVDVRRNSANAEIRSRANDVINVVNLASDATAEIEKLVSSISGIIEQASNPKISESRRRVLEEEANQLVQEIRRKAQVKTTQGLRPLAGDRISLPVEEQVAKNIEFALPDGAKDAFGIGEIELSKKDSLSQTRTALTRAREQVEQLKDSVQQSHNQVKNTVAALEVALQNNEAAQTSIRDVDEALKVAGDTKVGIARDPGSALKSVGNLQKKALSLLE